MKRTVFLILMAVLMVVPRISSQGNTVVRYPRLLHGDLPVYPVLAQKARIMGVVQVRVTIEHGSVVGTETITGHPLLASAAIDNIKSWTFEKTVSTTFATSFTYRLDGTSEETLEPTNPKLELELPSSAKITARPPYTQTME
jgi:hypothetical protein